MTIWVVLAGQNVFICASVANMKLKQSKTVELRTGLCCVLSNAQCFSMIRCKENHPSSKLSPEDLDAIAEIKGSMKDRTNVFSEMEAFLPKKNGFVILNYYLYMDDKQ